jgi:acyl-CoA thioesterase I
MTGFIRALTVWIALGFSLGAGHVAAAAESDAPVIVVLGDSLSAAYGIDARLGWVSLLEARLADEGLPHRVVNASVSGETSAGGLARLPRLLERHSPDWVLIELGGNDGLRGLPVKSLQQNLQRMVELSNDAGAQPVLFEMMIPSNYGPAYTGQFAASFSSVAKASDAPLVPFLLASIATDSNAFLPDGIHPTAASQPIILDAVWTTLGPLLAD